MAGKIKDWMLFKCPYCSCEYYDRTARKGKKVGDPMVQCPVCGKKSYRKSILEPALIGGKRYFDIKFSSLYGNFRIGIILIYAVFLFVILQKKSFSVSIWLLLAAAVIFCFYGLVRVLHRKVYLKTEEYNAEIIYSLKRLSDIPYAKTVIASQGMDKDSVYYYELNKDKKE